MHLSARGFRVSGPRAYVRVRSILDFEPTGYNYRHFLEISYKYFIRRADLTSKATFAMCTYQPHAGTIVEEKVA